MDERYRYQSIDKGEIPSEFREKKNKIEYYSMEHDDCKHCVKLLKMKVLILVIDLRKEIKTGTKFQK
jgi:hypothetical protein